jgi:hypothetical protein
MKKLTWTRPALVLALAAVAAGVAAAQAPTSDVDALRARLEQRFDILPLSDAVALRPKAAIADVRLIEVADTISINGVIVTGRELRERVGADADAILRLSYLDAEARQRITRPRPEDEPQVPAGEPEVARPPSAPPPAVTPDVPVMRRDVARRQRSGDRVRIFGDVHVTEGERLAGQAVAVMGSVRIDGEVDDQVVAVMGSVHLGPRAVVRGDIVSVGGRIHRAPGSEARGDVTEVALGGGVSNGQRRWPRVVNPGFGAWDGFGAVPRLVGSTFRLLLLALLAAVALLVARPVVESAAERVRDMPIHSTLIGILSFLLLGPILLLVSMVLIISIIGLPLLITIPLVLLAVVLMALAGFSGTAYAAGEWAGRRLNMATTSPFVAVSLGVALILLPLLLGRVIALAGWWGNPVAMLLVAIGFGVEFLAWSAGFGAVLANAFGRWQARRSSPVTPPPSPAPNVGP